MSRHYRTIVTICSLLAAGLSFAAAPAYAAGTVYYFVSGVLDDGSASGTGVATTFFCTNLAPVQNNVSVVVHTPTGPAVGVKSAFGVGPKATMTVSTHSTTIFSESNLATGIVGQGYAVISATNPNLVCSAMIVDASSSSPQGIALHMQRRAPLPDSQE